MWITITAEAKRARKLSGMKYHGGEPRQFWLDLVGIDPASVRGVRIETGRHGDERCITADDVKHKLKNARYADGRNAWNSAEDMTRDISAELRRRGIPHAPAQYDAGGNCLTCGEGGRCPGVHTFEEIQAAGRARS